MLRERMNELARMTEVALPEMSSPSSPLFANKVTWDGDGSRRSGVNGLYSAMSVVGLCHASRDVRDATADLRNAILDVLCASGHATVGERACTLLALASCGDPRGMDQLRLLALGLDVARASSMELGLVLAAVAAGHTGGWDQDPSIELSEAAGAELERRYVPQARVFRATGRRSRHAADHALTSFASQVYPIHGISELARATGADLPGFAVECADSLVERQGPFGQWWWLYSVRNGSIVDGYPVYSVHQHAMAFMALVSVERAGGRSSQTELSKGLDWVYGTNELGIPLIDEGRRTVYRCIQRVGSEADGRFGLSRGQVRRNLRTGLGLGRMPGTVVAPSELEVLKETRPYELGWLLYANALLGTLD